jgi:hypothetical protein
LRRAAAALAASANGATTIRMQPHTHTCLSLFCSVGIFLLTDCGRSCVPDVTTKCIQDYYVSWGKAYLDGGVRAFFFGQSRLTGSGRACNADGTGCSRVSTAGAAGFAIVLQQLKDYAASRCDSLLPLKRFYETV